MANLKKPHFVGSSLKQGVLDAKMKMSYFKSELEDPLRRHKEIEPVSGKIINFIKSEFFILKKQLRK